MRELTERAKALLVDSIPESNLALFCPALHGRGATLYDRSRNANNGTITGATWTRLPSGLWVLSFNGTTDVVTVSHAASLSFGTTSFSVVFWLKAPLTGHESANPRVLAKLSNYYIFQANGTNATNMRTYDGVHVGSVCPPGGWDNAWHQLGMIVDRDAQKLYGYVDATLGDTDADISDVGDASTSNNLAIGGITNHHCKGLVGLPIIVGRAITSTELTRLYTRHRHLFGV